MLKVRKDAIKVKTSEGMQSVGVLANVGTFGVDWFHYMVTLNKAFYKVDFGTPTDLDIFLGKNISNAIESNPLGQAFDTTKNLKSVKLCCNNPEERTIQIGSAFFASSVESVDLTEFTTRFTYAQYAFRACTNLVSIFGEIDLSSATNVTGMFENCPSLENVKFKENSLFKTIAFSSCSKLSDASIKNIIEGLADITGNDAQIIYFHADVKAKLTEAQISQITSKNWTLA